MKTIFPLSKDYPNPLHHPIMKETSIWELIKELIQGKNKLQESNLLRPFNCIQIEVSSFCMAKCTYCPHTTKQKQWKSCNMSEHTFANLWPLLKLSKRVHLQGWGEPLLHPQFFDFVALARKAGCLVSTTSCGIHLKEEIIENIIKSGIDIIAFSLVGTDKESNSPREHTDFDMICQSIQKLQELRKKNMAVHLEIHVAYLLLTDRIDALKKLPQLMLDLDIHATIISTLDYLADEKQENLAIHPQDITCINKAKILLEEISKKIKANGQELYYSLPGQKANPECREDIQNSFYVDAEGTISPCIYLNVPYKDSFKKIYGNVNDEFVLDIWNKEDFVSFRKKHLENNVIEQCRTCVKKF